MVNTLALTLLTIVSTTKLVACFQWHNPFGQPRARGIESGKSVVQLVTRSKPLPKYVFGRSNPVRGVNLGGWLLLEPWITPSIFEATNCSDVIDEYTLGAFYGDQASEVLTPHWDTFITKNDFKTIKSYGLNLVRIPIVKTGYWAFDVSRGEPYAQGQLPYLKKAVMWAKQTGLYVIIDLHGAPGSQNGFDNSGQRGIIRWNLTGTDNVKRTLSVLQTIRTEFSDPKYGNTVAAIEALNEPGGGPQSPHFFETVKKFYLKAYKNIRTSGDKFEIIYHDAFKTLAYWSDFMPKKKYKKVTFAMHPYFIFSEKKLQMSNSERLQAVCDLKLKLTESQKYHSSIVGEWSACVTDCAKYINGRGRGSRYDGTYQNATALGSCYGKSGSAATFSKSFKIYLRKFWEVQARIYSSSSGWIMWTWKTEEGAGEDYSYSAGIEYGWIPKNPTSYKYPSMSAYLFGALGTKL